jgi:hypothetical protein
MKAVSQPCMAYGLELSNTPLMTRRSGNDKWADV